METTAGIRVKLGLICVERSDMHILAMLVLAASILGQSAQANTEVSELIDPEIVGMSQQRLERIGIGMRRLIAENKIPGTVTLVARRGQIVHFEANGFRNVRASEPMELNTIFRLFSQTKPVTGAAVMILYEEGHFVLTDPISQYLPEFTDMQVYADGKLEPAGDITIQHLLSHTSGISYEFFPTPVGEMYRDANLGPNGADSPYDNLADWTKTVAKLPLVAHPGTDWNYSVGMDVLGRLVEVVSGKSFRAFLKERIFDPLEMKDTDFYVPEEKLSRFSSNYSPAPDGSIVMVETPMSSPYRELPKIESGGGGLVGTAMDYFRFAQMLANGGVYKGTRILGPRTIDLMMSNQLNPEIRPDALTSLMQYFPAQLTAGGTLGPTRRGDATRSWGIGFGLTGFVVTDPGLTGIPMSKGTFSWGGAATTHFWVDPKEELVGIVLTQLLPDGTYPMRQLMQQLTYQAIVD